MALVMNSLWQNSGCEPCAGTPPSLSGAECVTLQGTVSPAHETRAPLRARRHRGEGSLLGGSREPARELDFEVRPCRWGGGGSGAAQPHPFQDLRVVSCLECEAQERRPGLLAGPRDTHPPALFAGLPARFRDSLAVQWLGLRASTAGDVGSAPS